jgi:hypothetical protein
MHCNACCSITAASCVSLEISERLSGLIASATVYTLAYATVVRANFAIFINVKYADLDEETICSAHLAAMRPCDFDAVPRPLEYRVEMAQFAVDGNSVWEITIKYFIIRLDFAQFSFTFTKRRKSH